MDIEVKIFCDCKNQKENWIFFINSISNHFSVFLIHADCERVIKESRFELSKTEKFDKILEEIKQFSSLKPPNAGICLADDESFKRKYEFKEFLKNFCISIKIPFLIIDFETLLLSSILYGSSENFASANSADTLPKDIKIIHVVTTSLIVFNLKKVKGSFKLLSHRSKSLNLPAEKIEEFIFDNYKNFGKFILSFCYPAIFYVQEYEAMLECDKLVSLKGTFLDYMPKALISMLNELDGGRKCIFKQTPKFEGNLIVKVQEKGCAGRILMERSNDTLLPYSKSVKAEICENEEICVYAMPKNGMPPELMQTIIPSNPAKTKVTVKLNIDTNGFYSINIEPIVKKVKSASTISENSTVSNSEVGNSEAETIFIILSNSAFTINLESLKSPKGDNYSILPFINFQSNPITFGQDAKNASIQYPTFAVYDLLKIIDVIHSGAEPNPLWKFSIAKNSDGISFMIFDTWRGKRKTTPQFLMAILIGHLLKIGKDRIGFEPKKVKFVFEETENLEVLKEVVQDACKMLNVVVC